MRFTNNGCQNFNNFEKIAMRGQKNFKKLAHNVCRRSKIKYFLKN